ncbi:MAG: excinuclease ABC subunit UvrB [Candidatus Omnitrophota bacterium]|jgi:excinuclease ABC subunit B|nr:excinuclease ABC subunit UvrB [Candidatus Omnitrophota bacterium]MDD5527047.1 excinuclease ABC subunit UvrB [Candidatus Omnitrophota bacterium]
MSLFKLVSSYRPRGDQPQAIEKLTRLILSGNSRQTLLGVTGSGKTFTLANVIAGLDIPVLVISHNKTLAAQLYSEFKEFFPHNAVEYFVSYYDYYQPEAYIPSTDTYIEKDASINDRLDRLRLSATSSLMSRRDVIIVASVSCIYNLGSPDDYRDALVFVEKGSENGRDRLMLDLVNVQYERNDYEFKRGRFRVRGDTVEIYPAYRETALRVEFHGDRVEKISEVEPVSGNILAGLEKAAVYPAKHFLVAQELMSPAMEAIGADMRLRCDELRKHNKLLEAQRLESRTKYDMEMLKETGYCHGIENYSRYLSGRPPGSRPYCLMDYFPGGFLTIIDESHVTVPQLRGMFEGDRARKEVLIEYGFRLPSCLDNRPLRFPEIEALLGQAIFVSATPEKYEIGQSKGNVVEQIIRPTGLVDPRVEIKPVEGQTDDLLQLVKERASRGERTLVTTLTKRMAEDLSTYLQERGVRVKYLHSEVKTFERSKILKGLRKKDFDCVVGVNLLREGLDLPEVSLVAILDADKEGFLRSATSLIQVSGRAARNINGTVVMYADSVTDSMRKAISESNRRRTIQLEYNKEHGITPVSVNKAIKDGIEIYDKAEDYAAELTGLNKEEYELNRYVSEMEYEMELAARNLQFEKAAAIRDKLKEIGRLKK